MLTIEKLDWNRLWSEDRKACTTVRDQEHWNRRAPLFAQIVQANDNDDYVGPFLRIVNAQPEWSVLDVGCGAGTLASPLAKMVRQVTAIDFSPAMIALLEEHNEPREFAMLQRIWRAGRTTGGPWESSRTTWPLRRARWSPMIRGACWRS
jgi:2-polyprenyl-3-methyl-5-hydroxy-6-metoxy-1,4-benzoquinol methylase